MKPIIIGSTALEIHLVNDIDKAIENVKDIDIISDVNLEIKGVKLDIIKHDNFKHVIEYIDSVKCKTITLDNHELRLCPLDVLYVIYKSHIHRIINHFDNFYKNCSIWISKMKTYNKIREILGYKKMDEIIFKQRDNPLSKLYFKQWDIMTKLHGDTHSRFNVGIEEFFKNDGLERYVEHDLLHEYVAKLFRNTPDLLFRKALLKPTDVEMNEELFMKMPSSERIQCIYEEYCVLLIERPIIIGLMKKKFNMSRKMDYINMIVAHFSTNLNGEGHHWLRRYVIDHAHVLYPKLIRDFDTLLNLGVKIIKENVKDYDSTYLDNFKNQGKLIMLKFKENVKKRIECEYKCFNSPCIKHNKRYYIKEAKTFVEDNNLENLLESLKLKFMIKPSCSNSTFRVNVEYSSCNCDTHHHDIKSVKVYSNQDILNNIKNVQFYVKSIMDILSLSLIDVF